MTTSTITISIKPRADRVGISLTRWHQGRGAPVTLADFDIVHRAGETELELVQRAAAAVHREAYALRRWR